MKRVLVFSLLLSIFWLACDGNQPKPVTREDKDTSSEQVKPASETVGAGSTGNSPSTASNGTPNAPNAGGPAKDVAEKPAELIALEKAFEKTPNDEAAKKKLALATFEFAKKITYDNALPVMKYRQALKLFRRSLELDPSNQQAVAEKEQIEGIYRSMGRPIPES